MMLRLITMIKFIIEFLRDTNVFWYTLVGIGIYFWLTKNHRYWAVRNVKYIPPVPLFGNTFRTTFSLTPFNVVQQEQYKYFSGSPFGGIFHFSKPKLLIRDLNLIEHILIKDFSYFMNREVTLNPEKDIFAKSLLNVSGKTWKTLRNKLTPVFSSGKIKSMMIQISDCSDELIEHIEEKILSAEPIELRDKMAGLTMDIIGSCGFGLNFQAISDPNSQFKIIGKKLLSPTKKGKFNRALRNHFGFIIRVLGIGAIGKEEIKFFHNIVHDTVKYREENNFKRNDFIQLMLEVRKEEERQLNKGTSKSIFMDDKIIESNAFVFLLAGFETTTSALSYILYELSQSQQIQEKLYNEIVGILKKYNGEINGDSLKEMMYLEQVILEALRKHPPAGSISRVSTKPYKIPNSDMVLPEGSVINIPIYSIHHDPNYYPNPEIFDPERFSETNKKRLVKYTFMPFGDGPRMCIALRFAKIEIKIALIKLIQNFKFNLNRKTSVPLKYSPYTRLLTPHEGIWVDVTSRRTEVNQNKFKPKNK